MIRRLSLCVVAAWACSDSSAPLPPLPSDLNVVVVASGLSAPLFVTAPPADPRLFIVEKTGRIRVVRNGQLLATPYLDVAAKITSTGERGLLGLAFHPDFASNGFFYINYTDLAGDTRIERYSATPSADVANAASASLVLGFDQPFSNHNGGMIAFGPDGMLWIGTGDGGSGGDPQNNGQRLTTLLGKMLRIDVNAGSEAYAIPPDNPFTTHATNLPEIWGWGLRNPWRYSFDAQTGDLYVADVGQNRWEEVHVVPSAQASVNYGWRIMEGLHCFNPSTCDQSGLNLPVVEYSHDEGSCSVTGGYVYRGNDIPAITGRFFYSDYCSGFLRSFRLVNGVATEQVEWDVGALGNVTSFGEDAAGELHIVDANGRVLRLSP